MVRGHRRGHGTFQIRHHYLILGQVCGFLPKCLRKYVTFLVRVVFLFFNQHIVIIVFILGHIVEETKQTAEETNEHKPN